MPSTEKQHKMETSKLSKLTERKGDLEAKSQQAQAELVDSKKLFGTQLAEGNSSIDSLADGLARKQAEVSVYESALTELNEQIATQEAIVAEAQKRLDNERKSEATRKLRLDCVKLIKQFADAQLEIARMERLQQAHGIQLVDFRAAGTSLAEVQEICERDPVVKEKSKVPHAGRIGGFIDDQGRIASRGAPILDFAWEKTS